jgi:hypothetical protein
VALLCFSPPSFEVYGVKSHTKYRQLVYACFRCGGRKKVETSFFSFLFKCKNIADGMR